MTTPTPGRIMWFYPDPRCGESDFTAPRTGEPLAAIVASVRPADDLCLMVNLSVFDADGKQHPRQNVIVVQDGDPVPDCAYSCWMPYQINQAKNKIENAAMIAGQSIQQPTPEQQASYRRHDAISMACGSKRPDDNHEQVLAAARDYEAYLAGDVKPDA